MLSLIPLSLLALSAFSFPTKFNHKRAGGPSITPIPSNCTITNPLLCTSAESCPPQSGCPVRPTAASLQSPPSIYSYYLELDQPGTQQELYETCLEQCYGFGEPGDCLSVYHAYNYPAPPLYGGPGGSPSIACIMFSTHVTTNDFEVVPVDQQANYTQINVGSIYC